MYEKRAALLKQCNPFTSSAGLVFLFFGFFEKFAILIKNQFN
jgi:hypothetical protein